MIKNICFLFTFLSFFTNEVVGQEGNPAPAVPSTPVPAAEPLQLLFPVQSNWNNLKEGEKLDFELKATGGSGKRIRFGITQGKMEGMQFDSLGHFVWTPAYNFVTREIGKRHIVVTFEARNEKNERVKQEIQFSVDHVNQPPVVGELKPFYVQSNVLNSYSIETSMVRDEDNDSYIFVPILDKMPEGAKLSPKGEFTWKPSVSQFAGLKSKPIILEFYVEDQPAKERSKGQFVIERTQQDLPPSMQIIPTPPKNLIYKEDATIKLTFILSDGNGDDDISTFSFLAENANIPASALVKDKKMPTQYEFNWRPGYDFVKDPLDSTSFKITFFVMDKSNLRQERVLTFSILNAVNQVERDQKYYREYRASLVRAWDLLEQLKEAEKDLKKRYNRARKGKKGRSLTNATLGATTGIAPVVITDPTTTKKVTTIGGTTVMTIGTLEATEVIGRSTKDLIERFNYILEKRNELQTKGDAFARKYSLTSARRKPEFMKDADDLIALMNLKGLVALELDAGWKNKQKPTDANISKTFKDFNAE